MAIIIEELGKGNHKKSVHRFTDSVITIGRGYNNHVVIDDRYVDAGHCVIEEIDGLWFIEDLDSTNGTKVNGKAINKLTNPPKAIVSGDTFQIGRKTCRFILPDHPIPATIKFSLGDKLTDVLGRLPVLIVLLMTTLALFCWDIYYSMQKTISWDKFVIPLLTALFYSLIYPTAYSLLTKLIKQNGRYVAHLSGALIWVIALTMTVHALSYVAFNVSQDAWLTIIEVAPDYLFGFLLLMTSSFISFHQSFKKRVLINISIIFVVFLSLQFIDYLKRDNFNPLPSYSHTLKQKDFLIRSPSTIDGFLNNSDALFIAKPADEAP